ncbi:TIR domain-containing protein [Paludisphaera soli]|uniref:TIR domain-containing protein n=1 Tax=Paludisphaera soli TaxID=2712865 RepID=UPI0013EDB95E|nr:TIR domain-containing protein [Paludisphaera soli]
MAQPQPTYPYKAFLSYSHATDGRLAPALQSALHSFAKPWYRLRAVRVFRDKTNLSANPAVWPAILQALQQSEFLLLMASWASAGSPWVRQELAYWLAERDPANLILVLTDGAIAWDGAAGDFDWARTSALPDSLRGRFRQEPLWVDLAFAKAGEQLSTRHPDFLDGVAAIAARLHGRSKDEIAGEDVRRHRQVRRVAGTAVLLLGALAALACGFGWLSHRRGTALTASLETAELEVAKGLFVPAEPTANGLTVPEVLAFTQLASLAPEQDRIRDKYLEHALEDRARASRLANRAPYAVQGAVGLDLGRRRRAEEIAARRFDAPDVEVRAAAAQVLAELGSTDLVLASRAGRILAEAVRDTTLQEIPFIRIWFSLQAACLTLPDDLALDLLGVGGTALGRQVATSGGRIDQLDRRLQELIVPATPFAPGRGGARGNPARAAAALRPAIDALVAALATKEKGPFGHDQLSRSLVQLVGWVDAAEADAVLGPVADAMCAALASQENQHIARNHLADVLVAVVEKLDTARAGQVADALTDALSAGKRWPSNRPALARALGGVAGRLDPPRAERIAIALLDALREHPATSAAGGAEKYILALQAVALRLDSGGAERMVPALASLLADLPDIETVWDRVVGLDRVLEAMARGADRDQVRAKLDPVAVTLARRILEPERGRNPDDMERISRDRAAQLVALGDVASRLPPTRAKAIVSPVIDTLSPRLSRARSGTAAPGDLVMGMVGVLGLLDPVQAAQVADDLVAEETQIGRGKGVQSEEKTTSALIYALQERQADPELAGAFAAAVGRLERVRAADVLVQAADSLAAALMAKSRSDFQYESTPENLARALGLVVERLDPERARRITDALFAPLLAKESSPAVRARAARVLGAVASRLHPAQAESVLAIAADALPIEAEEEARRDWIAALGAIGGRVDPTRAGSVLGRAADTLAAVLSEETEAYKLSEAAGALRAVSLKHKLPARGVRRILTAWARSDWGHWNTAWHAPLELALGEAAAHLNLGEVVDALKHPLCVGSARVVLLRRAEQLAGVPPDTFPTQWEFVAWVRAAHPGIDLPSPPAVD